MKDLQSNGGVVDKTSSGTLTFADADTTVNELKDVLKGLSVKEDGKPVKLMEKLYQLLIHKILGISKLDTHT